MRLLCRSRRSLAAVTLVALAATLLGARPAAWGRGEPQQAAAPGSKAAQAHAHYEKAVTAYNLARFDEAIAGFSRAYALDPAPILLFNLAQAHWKRGEAGDERQALFFYRRYLEAEPASANRQRVESRIRELEARQRPEPTLPAHAAPPATAPAPASVGAPATALTAVPERPPLHHRPWFWGALAVVAAVSVASVLALRSGERPWTCGTDCRTRVVE
jgi:tetratricopeptide (TPR) repeat protein